MIKVALVGEAWGKDEELVGHSFVGASGINLIKLLDQVGLIALTAADRQNIHGYYRAVGGDPHCTAEIWKAHPEIFLTNVFNFRPKPSNDIKNLCGGKKEGIFGWPALARGKYIRKEFLPELDRLFTELRAQQPNIIITFGEVPTWALLKTQGIKAIRGYTAQSWLGYKVLPTYRLNDMLFDWSLRPIILADLTKAKAEAEFPEVRRPRRMLWIEPTIEDLKAFSYYIYDYPDLSVDIENMGPVITCIGFAPSQGQAIVVPFYDARQPDRNYWRTFEEEKAAWEYVRDWLSRSKRIVFQNGLYDMHHLWKTMGLPTPHAAEDTMLLHHALQPELPKGLGFLGSVYTNEGSWKTMRGEVGTIKGED